MFPQKIIKKCVMDDEVFIFMNLQTIYLAQVIIVDLINKMVSDIYSKSEGRFSNL